MRGLATFAFWTVLAAALCAAAFFALATLFFGTHPNAHLEAVAEGRTDALVALLAFVFGTAATVAGAVATVYVSNLALRLSQDGERRETLRFAADRLDEAIEHIADMAAAVNALHTACAALLPGLDRFAEGYSVPLHHLRENDQERLLRQHGGAVGFMASAIDRLAEAIEGAARDDFTRSALLHQLAARSVLGESPAMFSFFTLGAAPARLRLAALELRDNPAWGVIEARMVADLTNAPDARAFVFAGALIAAEVERPPGETPSKAHVHGAALLAELALALPDGETLTGALAQRYHGVVTSLGGRKLTLFDPRAAMSPALLQGARAAVHAGAMRPLIAPSVSAEP